LERAQEALDWLSAVLEKNLDYEEGSLKDQNEFANILKDGILLCECVIFVFSKSPIGYPKLNVSFPDLSTNSNQEL
jgi:hypothetical protein